MTPRKHKHASLIKQWLDDDSLVVEIEHTDCPEWRIDQYPDWHESRNYRFKPKMIKCGDLEFPEPMRVAPAAYAVYFVIDITRSDLYMKTSWTNDVPDNTFLKRGLCHTTQAAAEAHARALIALTESKP